MAVPTIAQVMAAIETRLVTISGLRVDDLIPEQINPPVAIVGVPPIPQYHQSMGMGHFRLEPTVTVLVSAAISRIGQIALAGYANPTGSGSIRAAIEGDRTLGGVVEDCIVTDFRPLGHEEVGAIGYFGGVFGLTVIALGT